MKFVHITDTHLGYHQYGLEERARDFFDVFEEAVEFAIGKKVDFVIHSGDFFHTSRPSNAVLLEGINLVNRLKEANIPVFIIPGNHDRGSRVKDVSPLHILKNFGAKLIEQDTIEYDGIYISGLKYLSKFALKKIGSIKPVLEKFLEKGHNAYFHILMLHQEFSPYFPNGLYLSKEVPEGFSYIGIGHFHENVEPFKYGEGWVVYPGSTEFTAYSQNEDKKTKGFYFIEKNNEIKIQFIPLQRRRPYITVEFEENSIEDIIKTIKNEIEIKKSINKKAPVIILKGYIQDYTLKDIASKLAKEGIYPDKENVLYINFVLKRKEEAKKQKDIFSISVKELDIETELKKLLEDEDTFNKVYELISTAKTMESIDDFKTFLKENEDKLDI